MKKLFIKIARYLGYELIDQSNFSSPTLNKTLDQELSIINKKSIVLPLGEVKITRKVNSLFIVIRMNTDVEIWDQNKRRLFEKPKIEYSSRSLRSLIKSINSCKKKYPNILINTVIIDDNSNEENIGLIKNIIKDQNIEIISLDYQKFKTVIKEQKTSQTFANLASLLESFKVAKERAEDLILFVEDDYLHFEEMIEEVVASYEKIASQLKKDIFMCPTDYPYLYMENDPTNILIGNKRHWRTIDKTLCTFITSNELLNKYWDNFHKTCLDRSEPFEKYLNEIYKKEICISPIKSLSVHLTNINSSYGLSPFIDYKKLWDEN